MSTSSPSEEARRYAEALVPFKIALRVWDRLLDAHSADCDCQLCEELYPVSRVFGDLYSLLESGAPGDTLRLVLAEIGGDGEDDDTDTDTDVQPEATPAAQEAKAPRGGYF
jgi:hypothetical protein